MRDPRTIVAMAHNHGSVGDQHSSRLVVVLAMTGGVMVVEVLAGWWTHSLALIADAGHMFADGAGIAMALGAIVAARKISRARGTYGYYRLEILAAAINAVLLLAVASWVVVAAWRRINDPVGVDAGPMLVVAVAGLLVNAVGLRLLRTGQRDSLNLRGAYLEVLGDLLGSVAVVTAAAVIALTGYERADPIASVVIGVLIVPRTWLLLREAVDILLEATPKHIDLEHIREHIRSVDGVVDVHDLHVWTITSGMPVMSAHVVVARGASAQGSGPILDRLGECLHEHFDVAHCTFQIEPVGHFDHEMSVHP
jgi:cobalt-zinc-cadmium efflux system protein